MVFLNSDKTIEIYDIDFASKQVTKSKILNWITVGFSKPQDFCPVQLDAEPKTQNLAIFSNCAGTTAESSDQVIFLNPQADFKIES